MPADFIETTHSITVIAKRIKQKWRYLPPLLSFKMPKCADPQERATPREKVQLQFAFIDANWSGSIAL